MAGHGALLLPWLAIALYLDHGWQSRFTFTMARQCALLLPWQPTWFLACAVNGLEYNVRYVRHHSRSVAHADNVGTSHKVACLTFFALLSL